ncbi:MAG: ribonuclease HIII [Planctomycetota bacterium]
MSRPTVVVTLDPAGAGEELREKLGSTDSFRAHKNPGARWAFRGEGVVVSLYASGKCVVQGAGAEQFAERFLGGRTERKLEALEDDLIGTDESGKGDYFGPLVAAAVLVPKGQEAVLEELGVRDSKELGDRAASRAAATIREGCPCEVVVIGPARYNELYEDFGNLNHLLAWATAQAVAGVLAKRPCRNVLSDKFGNESLIREALEKKGIDVDLVQRVRAESNPAVAAASLVARDAFLRSLGRLGKEIGVPLRKGAGDPVLAVARRIYQDGGREALRKVAKLHFKTTARISEELF